MCWLGNLLTQIGDLIPSFPRRRESSLFSFLTCIPALSCNRPLGRNDNPIWVRQLTRYHSQISYI